ncbi:MAG: hypothetical protein ACTSRP_09135 [Candidatus Helarchaeota archaeon]
MQKCLFCNSKNIYFSVIVENEEITVFGECGDCGLVFPVDENNKKVVMEFFGGEDAIFAKIISASRR